MELKINEGTINHPVRIILIGGELGKEQLPLQQEELSYLQEKLSHEQRIVEINHYTSKILLVGIAGTKDENQHLEAWRRAGNEVAQWARKEMIQSIEIGSTTQGALQLLAFAEGIVLGSYQFLKYQSKAEKLKTTLSEICFTGGRVTQENLAELSLLAAIVYQTRDLVNEPVIALNAEKLGEVFQQNCAQSGVKLEVLNKSRIEALGMGGLLAVNKGSIDPPTFSVMEWKPANAFNNDPIVLVGKGVVFDTGGLSLKPTAKSMDYMKSDMAGAAAVAGAIQAAARNNMPLYLVALIPSTDNRPGGNAITPGDVITISNGATVEVLNTDAEGRLILADALSYANRYHPMLVIDLATLTGSASMTLGIHGIAAMGSQSEEFLLLLKQAGEQVNERLVELPLWDEYDEMIKSTIADMKNIGGGEAGAITAGKFLQRFVSYPWIHLDIAGPAFIHAADHYRTVGGTATGVRLLFQFFKTLVQQFERPSL